MVEVVEVPAKRAGTPMVHTVVPLRSFPVDRGISEPRQRPRTAELTVTDFKSPEQTEDFAIELKATLRRLKKEGLGHIFLRLQSGDVPEEIRETLTGEFDFVCYGRDSRGHRQWEYHKVFDERCRMASEYLKGVGSERAHGVVAVFKGNLWGIEGFLEKHTADPNFILNVKAVGGDGNPYGVVEGHEGTPFRKCICDYEERRHMRFTLSQGYVMQPKGGAGWIYILTRKGAIIQRLFGGRGTDDEADRKFCAAMFKTVKDPEMILPSVNLMEYYSTITTDSGGKVFLGVTTSAGGKERHIVTAYIYRDAGELKEGLKGSLTHDIAAGGQRLKYLGYVNAYLAGKGAGEIKPGDIGL